MNRRTARENAFIAAFELGFGAQSLEDIIEYSEECGEYALDEFAQKLLRCYLEYAAQADELIRPRLKNWTLERLPRTSRTLLLPGHCGDALFWGGRYRQHCHQRIGGVGEKIRQ